MRPFRSSFRTSIRLTALIVVCAARAPAWSADPPQGAEAAPRFTFGGGDWKPRGGTSHGPPVVIDRSPSAAWNALQAPGLDARERDRRAILAMAGAWRVAFDYVEVASFPDPNVDDGVYGGRGASALAPYQSWGTEKVYVDRDEPGRISLVHILEMRIVGADGSVGEPIVTKHWRQEWVYQPKSIVEYRGRDRWQSRAIPTDEGRGAWSQTVMQVDESPRYASTGHWVHTPSFSTWIGDDTWRPLPRREWTVRHDYQVLLGTNRHTIVPTGWLQEENNLKAVVTADRTVDARHPYVAREVGVARYERLADPDFAAADQYYARTRAFWDRVEDTWNADFATRGTIALSGQSDEKAFFVPLFERADRIAETGPSLDDDATIRTALDRMRAPDR